MTNLTNGNDTYSGTDGDDIVNGRGGDDIINGLGGDDQIIGGSGNDTIDGGQGDDQISGGSDNDILTGGLGNDILIGGSGDDTAVINADGATGVGSHNGGTLTVTTVDGEDELTGIEHIRFNNGTVDIINGNAQAFLGADTLEVSQGAGPDSPVQNNVLNNDFDIDDTMTLTGFSTVGDVSGTVSLGSSLHGEFGSLTLNANGSYSYVADGSTQSLGEGEHATDVFTYYVTSGGTHFSQTITITIDGQNDDPVITSSATSTTYTDTSGDDTGNFSNYSGSFAATDPDTHDVLTYSVSNEHVDGTVSGYDHAVDGTYGKFYFNESNGDYLYVPDDDAIQALKSGASESFTMTVSDGHGGTDSQFFTVNLDGANDTPTLSPIADITYTDTAGDDSSTIMAQSGTLVASDRDAGENLTFDSSGSVSATFDGFDHSVSGTYGTLYFNSTTGAYEFVPDDGAIEGLKAGQTETFDFSVTDGSLSSSQTLTIHLNGVNDTPDMFATSATALTEAGTGVSGTADSSSSVTLTDRDTGDTPHIDGQALVDHGWTNNHDGTFSLTGTYGTATVNCSSGVVSYHLDDSAAATQGLNNGDLVHDTFTVYGTDGSAGASIDVTFDINGSNDAAVISGSSSGEAAEAGGVNNGTAGSGASGVLTDNDVDNPANTFQAVTSGTSSACGFGTYTIDASGHWTFAVNEDSNRVQQMNVGDQLTDHFTVYTQDGTAQVITVVIDGANDAAIVSGDTSGSVTESGSHVGAQVSGTTSGHLISNDVDNDANFQFGSGTTQNGYGTYEINSSGDWTFTLNNADHTVQALNDGETLTETFTVHTTDGTDQVVSIVINGANEIYNGTANADVIRGDAYGDTMTGFAGNDTYFVNNTADKVVELSNDGYDTVQATVSYTLSDNVEALLLGGHLDINGTGNGGDNAIAGNAGANMLSGLGGDDSLTGGNGNDTLNGGDGDDLMNGGVGNDTASYAGATAGVTVSLAIASYQDTGGAGFDKLVSIENLTGSSFADMLTGNTGNNIITGGGGADVLTGGVGHDVFVYTAASDSAVGNSDTITDLTNADSIDLSALGSDFTIVSSFTGHADQITLHFDGTHTTISIDLDGNGSADMAILVNGDHHTFHDFIGLGQ